MTDSGNQTVGSRLTRFSNSPWPIMIAVLAILVASVQVLVSQAQGNQQQQCLYTFANKLHDVLQPRQDDSEALQAADTKFNDALVKLLKDALVNPPEAQAQGLADAKALQAAAIEKKNVAAKLTKERVTKPYPPPPRQAC